MTNKKLVAAITLLCVLLMLPTAAFAEVVETVDNEIVAADVEPADDTALTTVGGETVGDEADAEIIDDTALIAASAVPYESAPAEQAAEDIKSGNCGENATWTLADGVLTISGTGAMPKYQSVEERPWNDYVNEIQSVKFDGISDLGNYAFAKCNITSVEIPDSVKEMGAYAFQSCESLQSVTIPNSVSSTGLGPFMGCSALTSVTIADGVTTIGYDTFYGCTSLTSVTIPGSVTRIFERAFMCCESLESVIIPDKVTRIEASTFFECSSLQSVTIPNSVTSIDGSAFYNCESLQSITIPDSVTSIGSHAFENCKALTSIELSNSVKNIAENAFKKCNNLTDIRFNGTKEELEAFLNGAGGVLGNIINTDNIACTCKDGNHDISREEIAATCTGDGYTVSTCSRCDYNEESDRVTALGHKYSITVNEEATCTKKGSQTYTCVRTGCNYSYTETIEMSDHVKDEGRVTKEASCTETGIRTYACKNCGAVLETEIIEMSDHVKNEGTVTKEASCTEQGTRTYACKNCGAVLETEIIEMSDHVKDEGRVTKEASCTETGIRSYTCKICGAELPTEEIPKVAHQTELRGRQEATATENGYTGDLVCKVCNTLVTKGEVILATGSGGSGSSGGSSGGSGSSSGNTDNTNNNNNPTAKPEDNNHKQDITQSTVDDNVIQAVTDTVKDDDSKEVIGGKDNTVHVDVKEDGVTVDNLKEPTEITIPVSKDTLDSVKNPDNLTLAQVTVDKDGNVVLINVGGNYDPKTGQFTAYVDKAGDYILIEDSNVIKIELQFGKQSCTVNGKNNVADVGPIIRDGQVLVPLRFVAEALGAKVDWNAASQTVTITADGAVTKLTIDQTTDTLRTAPILYQERTMILAQYIAEKLGAKAIYVPKTQKIIIVK